MALDHTQSSANVDAVIEDSELDQPDWELFSFARSGDSSVMRHPWGDAARSSSA
jgi:hypothetical protein